jgi:hypothetical protein
MTGGLIQLVSSGKQDGYLTYNPQITYFKKNYRRHTIFGIELIEIYPDQQPDYENRISFILNNISDLIGKCYIEIEIPTVSFTENETVTNLKKNQLMNIQREVNKWKKLYEDLKSYCSIEILLYQNLNKLLESINITLQVLKQNVLKFNSKYKKQKDSLTNLILDQVFAQIDLTGYIMQLDKMIVSDDYESYDANLEIKVSDLLNNIEGYYTNMIKNLKYYYTNYIYYFNQYAEQSNKNVNYAWNDNLAHIYFTDFEVELGGQVVEKYSLEQSIIYQTHHLKEEQKKNYDVMVGNTENLHEYSKKPKIGRTIILPLNFWFCKDMGCALPTVALSNSSVSINLKLNKLKNLIYFENYEQEYYNFLIITIPKDQNIYKNLNIDTFKIDIDSDLITYKCKNINYQLMALQYPSLSSIDKDDAITNILQTYGKLVNGEYTMELIEWINFRGSYTENQDIINPGSNNNFTEFYSSIPRPNIKLITESVYLDDIERNKFGSSKLEYVIEIFQENIYDIDKKFMFNAELSLDRPIKELMWITQPKLLLQGFSEYGKTYLTNFLFPQFFTKYYYSEYSISLNQINIIKPKLNSVFYNELQSYQYYNNSLLEGVYCYNFGLYPEETQPSGSANFTMFKGKLINFTLDTQFLSEYFDTNFNPSQLGLQLKFLARGYNFLVVEKGMGKMIFSTN